MNEIVPGRRRAPKANATGLHQAREGGRSDTGQLPPYRMARGDLWALIINGVFGALGLLMLPSNPSVGIISAAFFGSGAIFLGWLHWRRYQDYKLQLTDIEVAGGARILPRRGFLLTMGAWLAVLGSVLIVFGQSYPALLQWLGAFIAFSGATLLVLTVLRVFPPGFLQFEQQGLIIGQRGWHVLVPWDWIVDVRLAEIQNNPMVLLTVANVEQLDVTPAAARPKAQKAMAGRTWWNWGPFAILPLHYGIPSPVLAGAIKRYANDAAARKNLGARQIAGPDLT